MEQKKPTCSVECQEGSHTDQSAQCVMPERNLGHVYGKLPNEIAQRSALSCYVLVLLCFRITLPEDWALNPVHVQKELRMGRGSFFEAMRSLKKEGLLEREQDDGCGPSSYGYVTERLTIDAPTRGYTIVYRWWFSLGLSVKSLGAYIYICASSYELRLDEIGQRFGWASKETIRKHMKPLLDAKLIKKIGYNEESGRGFVDVYTDVARQLPAKRKNRHSKKRQTKNRERKNRHA